jgi:hypothetical protein
MRRSNSKSNSKTKNSNSRNSKTKNIKKSKQFLPEKYYKGLTLEEKKIRQREILKGKKSSSRNKSAYVPFTTDKNKKTKPSTYTQKFHAKFGKITSLHNISKKTGIPEPILKIVFNKGLAAWRTGHRPGATQSQWAYARVYSFVMKGCTFFRPDHLLVKEAIKKSPRARNHWNSLKSNCNKK